MITASGRPAVLAMGDPTMAGEARRSAAAIAARLGFDEEGRGKVALVATEAATNLCKHAEGGIVVLQGLERGGVGGVDILALDLGPGIRDVDRCLADGYSTAGSSGTGLGAMARQSSTFGMYSQPGGGTATLARLWAGPSPVEGPIFGAVSLPLAGEEANGDGWAISEHQGRTAVLVADGLGHGPLAAEAAREAVRAFEAAPSLGPAEYIDAAHKALRSTRGAALAVARIDPERGEILYAGVGNICGAVLAPGQERGSSMVSLDGTVGHTIRKIREFTYPWAPGSLLIMHSDGLATQWQLGRYPGLGSRHPGLVAGVLYRDFRRVRDDVTVVAAREGSASPR